MKNIIYVIFLLLSFSSVSQSGSWGIGLENPDGFGSIVKFSYDRISYGEGKKGFLIGIEYGQSFFQSTSNNMSGYIDLDEYPEDNTGDLKYSISTPSLNIGYEFINKFYFVASGGYNISKEFGVYNDGSPYYLKTGNTENSTYYKLGIQYISSKFSPKLGYGSNGVYFGISILTNVSKLERFNNNRKKVNQSKRIDIAGNKIYDINTYDLKAMINVFLQDCANRGIQLEENSIKATFEQLPKGVLALSYAMNNDKEIIIKVDPTNWQNSSSSKKWYLLYHELGHDVLNLNHGNGGKMMFNYADKDYTWDEFFTDSEYMFNNFE